ncbi:MAG: response regulator [Candidatus Omnitrophica bacterium]|nr:response regulator [Candidatus Omnitrophota bacterium]
MNISKKILLIDDDEELCEELTDFLRECGYQVNATHNGIQAREYLRQAQYDLIILDLKLPLESGFDILKDIKDTYSQLKVMIVSGRPPTGSLPHLDDWQAEELEILKLADRVLSKPLPPELLLQTIQELT